MDDGRLVRLLKALADERRFRIVREIAAAGELSCGALGAKIDVPTIDGKTTMTLPAGTQNGRRFRLRGKGVPALHGGGRGDHYVTVQVVLPEQLDAWSRQLLEEFAARNPLQPRAHMRW